MVTHNIPTHTLPRDNPDHNVIVRSTAALADVVVIQCGVHTIFIDFDEVDTLYKMMVDIRNVTR